MRSPLRRRRLGGERGDGGLEAGPIRIRVGIHTGEPALDPPKYVGMDVHRAARIMSAAHGGQVVLSPSTVSLLEPGTFELIDLGEHRLKDIEGAVSIFQLGDGSFPPLKTISNTNLPRPASSFVGREAELAEVLARIEGGARLVTLTGPGGTGKTRLALEAATSLVPEYKAGVFWVGLASLRDPALVTETISQTLGAKDGLAEHIARARAAPPARQPGAGDRRRPDALRPPPALPQPRAARHEPRATAHLRRGRVPGATARRARSRLPLLRAGAGRAERGGRRALRTPGQPAPRGRACRRPREGALARADPRAPVAATRPAQGRSRRRSTPADAASDDRVELRPALTTRSSSSSPASRSSPAAARSKPPRRSADADLDTLQSLVEKSLLRFTNERYWMLETIREYASERLARAGAQEQLERVHAARYARLAVDLSASSRGRSAETLQILREERREQRAALEFALQGDEAAVVSDLIRGLWFYWLTTGGGTEAAAWANRYLASSRDRLSPLERFHTDGDVAEILRFASDAETALRLKRELVAFGRDHPGTVIHGIVMERTLAATLSDLAYMELDAGRLEEARASGGVALRRVLGRPGGIAHALLALAAVAYYERDVALRVSCTSKPSAASRPPSLTGMCPSEDCARRMPSSFLGGPTTLTAMLRERSNSHAARVPGSSSGQYHALRVAGMLAAARGSFRALRDAVWCGGWQAGGERHDAVGPKSRTRHTVPTSLGRESRLASPRPDCVRTRRE